MRIKRRTDKTPGRKVWKKVTFKLLAGIRAGHERGTMMMNMTIQINLNDYSYSRGFEQALDTKQSLSLVCSYRFSYKRMNCRLECSDIGAVC